MLLQKLGAGSVAEDGGGRNILELDVEAFEENLDLELEVELELCELVELDHETQYRHEPRVGRLEDIGLGALFHHLADEGDGNNESIAVVALDEQLLESDVAMTDGLVASESEATEPRTEVLEQVALLRRLDRLVAVEQHLTLAQRFMQDVGHKTFCFEAVEELSVETVVVRLDADTLQDQVVGEPAESVGSDKSTSITELGVQVGGREVINEEKDLVRDLFAGVALLAVLRRGSARMAGKGAFLSSSDCPPGIPAASAPVS